MSKPKPNTPASKDAPIEEKSNVAQNSSASNKDSLTKRVEGLEKSNAEAYKAIWDGHKTFIAAVFTVGVVVSGFFGPTPNPVNRINES